MSVVVQHGEMRLETFVASLMLVEYLFSMVVFINVGVGDGRSLWAICKDPRV